MLNKKLTESGDTTAIQSMLEDAQSRVNELESDSRLGWDVASPLFVDLVDSKTVYFSSILLLPKINYDNHIRWVINLGYDI